MRFKDDIKELEERKKEVIEFTNDLEERLRRRKISKRKFNSEIKKEYGATTKEDLIKEINKEMKEVHTKIKHHQKTKVHMSIAGVVLIVIALIGIFSQYGLDTPTGLVTGPQQVSQTIDYNRVFEHYTETQLDLTNLTSLRISGILDGTRAVVKLRVDGIDYVVADITNDQGGNLITGLVIGEEGEETGLEYVLSTDKLEYELGEIAVISVTPDIENKSLYVNYGEDTEKLEGDTYITQNVGEHQAIALIVLPDDILRLETNFTVIEALQPIVIPINNTNDTINNTTNETVNDTIDEIINQTNQSTNISENLTPESTGYQFIELCIETCNLQETRNPILIIEPAEASTLTITTLTVVQNMPNQDPVQTRNIPDITITTSQTATIDLDEYFNDPDGDLVVYDINDIPEINAQVNLEILTINSQETGIFTAYIYATDGDQLVTSNTFLITIIDTTGDTNQTTNETNITITPPETPESPVQSLDPCSNPDINLRPATCFVGIEDKVFQDLSASIENRDGTVVGRFTRFGNLVIKGLLMQSASGTPGADDYKIGFIQRQEFDETQVYTAWIDTETGNLYLKGQLFDEQEVLEPSPTRTHIIQNKFGIILGYFEEITGNLYLKGNIVQLGKI